MIAKEAIEILKANYPDACFGQLREAVDAAIEALKAQDTAGDTIFRQGALDVIDSYMNKSTELHYLPTSDGIKRLISVLPSAQPQYEELTPEEAASEIASGSTMTAWYWLDDMIRLTQMGYVVCRKR